MSAAITISAIGTAISGYAAYNNAKKGGANTSAQEAAQAEDLAFRKEQYQRYLGLMGPIEEKLAAEAKSTQPLDYERNAAQVKSNYAAAQRGITSQMGLRGMAGSGLDEAAIRGAAYGQASDLSNAWAQGLVNRRNLGLTLTGRGQIGQAAQGVQGGLQGMANMYGNQANQYNAAAQQGWANFGQGLQDLASYLGGLSEDGGNELTQTNAIPRYQDQQPITPSTTNTYGLMPWETTGLKPWEG